MIIRESVDFGGKELYIETGRMAKQADGAVLVQYGDSIVLVTACGSRSEREGIDFLPLTCDYIEHTGASGRIPGGYFKREGRATEIETLTSRLIDRPSRPLFPKGWRCETQIIALVLSADQKNPTDIHALTGASTALHISDIPWGGPYVGVRVGRVDGQFVVNPTFQQYEESELNMVVAATRDSIVMVEGGASQLAEDVMVEALMFAHRAAQPVLDLQEKLRAAVGRTKRTVAVKATDENIKTRVTAIGADALKQATAVHAKQERIAAVAKVHDDTQKRIAEEFPESSEPGKDAKSRAKHVSEAFEGLKKQMVREQVLSEGRRIDGRRTFDIRQITCEVGVLPRTHGSALFTRGETQALVVTTLGTKTDNQRIETLLGQITKNFMLHYNFPPFSTGETKMMRGPSRREIGHGALAERALFKVIPPHDGFPYTIRIVSEILESNGSSSMASVCGGTLSLMDAGVPIKTPVAGIAMGLIYDKPENGPVRYAVLSDILGDEDHLGDMDFKVCGTKDGITALQMDIKIPGLDREVLAKALYQARDGRLYILEKMLAAMPATRANLSPYAPRIFTMQIKPDRIRDVIGPGGKMIRGIVEQTGVAIDVEDDGRISIASSDEVSAQKAMAIIKGLTEEAVIGNTYRGTVRRITDFGAFVEILPGTDGLVHISELDWKRVGKVEDVVKEGDELEVKVVSVDRMGKIRLSRKELLPKPEGYVEPSPESRERSDRPDRAGGDRGRREGGRGPGGGGGFRGPRR